MLKHWAPFHTIVVDDGRTGDAQFNRHAAYNKAAQQTDSDVLVYTESDMLIDHQQIQQAVDLASEAPGLVVPFTEYRYLSEPDSQKVRDGANPAEMTPESVISAETRSWLRTGPINVLHRRTLDLVGQWDETFEGCWWDDRAMKHAFDTATNPTRWIEGAAYHLYHLPGWAGSHLTTEDRAATNRNRLRYNLYRSATTPAQIRQLTKGATHA